VNRFPSEPTPFKVYRKEPGNPNSLDEDNVLSVFEDSQGILWIGTNQLNRLDRKTGRYTFYRHDSANSASISSSVVRAMAEDRAGFLWFGTWGGGLNQFDRRTGRFKAYRHDPADAASLSNDTVLSLLIDRTGTLWAGTDDGLNRLDARTGRFTLFRPKSGLLESWVRVLAEDVDGSIWMGTYTQGLHRLDVRTGEIVAYKNNPKVQGSLSNNRVNALCVDHERTLWVGTQNGLNRFDRKTGEFSTFGEREGLPNNAVEGILEDAAGNLWLSTGNGLSRFDPRARTFRNYYSDDGLAGDEFSDFSVYHKSARGEMFLGGVNGVTSFYPDKVVDRPFVPPVVLTDFRLFNDPVPVGGRSPLKKSISYTESLTLSHEQNIFSLEFSALSFASPKRARYRYRLEGLDRDWNESAATHRVITYTTLPAREYHFRVQSKDSRGGWGEPGLTLAIRVLPAWWNKWEFRTVWIVSVILLTWLVYHLRLHRMQREFAVRLEGRVEERTRLARELHDTLLQSFQGLMFSFQAVRNLLPGRTEEAMRTLDQAIREGDAAIAEGRDTVEGLRANPVLESNLEQLLVGEGKQLARSSNAEGEPPAYRVTVEGARQPLSPLLQDEVYRIASEILRNAFHHARASRIEAEIAYDRESFRLRIRDNGEGIDPKVREAGARSGHWGLPGVRERAKLIGARLTLWSELGAGTEVELTVPARIAYGTVPRRAGWRLFRKSKVQTYPPERR
jgi:signal transduction histidine kinase/sugar lactone lactonase YvrE